MKTGMKTADLSDACIALFKRDVLLLWRNRSEALNPWLFALIVATLFPLALGPEAQRLAGVAGGIIWVTVLLASLLSLDSLFRSDADDGSLEQIFISAHPLSAIAAVKILVHWLASGLPLTIAAPLLAVMLGMQDAHIPVLIASLALGTPLISIFGAVGASLTVGARRSGILLSLLVLPLIVPVLIFGAGAVEAVATGGSAQVPLLFLGVGLSLSIVLGPMACGAALKLHIS